MLQYPRKSTGCRKKKRKEGREEGKEGEGRKEGSQAKKFQSLFPRTTNHCFVDGNNQCGIRKKKTEGYILMQLDKSLRLLF